MKRLGTARSSHEIADTGDCDVLILILTVDLSTFFFFYLDLLQFVVILDEVEDGSAQSQIREEQQQQGEPLLLGHSRTLSWRC